MKLLEIVELTKAPVMGNVVVYSYFDSNRKRFIFHLSDEIEIFKFLHYVNESKKINYNFIHMEGNLLSLDEYEDVLIINEKQNKKIRTTRLEKNIDGTIEISVDALYFLTRKCDSKSINFTVEKSIKFTKQKFNKLEFLNQYIKNEIPNSKIIDYNKTSKMIKVNGFLIKLIGKSIKLMYIDNVDLHFNLKTLPYKKFDINSIDKILEHIK